MGKALYRKYRSKKLSEIVGQDHVTTALNNALKNGSISHAYLFTGPRGTGKTSIARILAHEVNQLPYDEDATHLDIIEIDAASNRRIDEIRSLREKVHNAPASAKYKVYIIDEVHMLTKEAFNALLKTLEEPPEHVIFILATTEAHKLPDTIISRTQRYTFKPAEPAAATEHLKTIAKAEGIDISDDALALVAKHGRGSFRDSISLLDQVSNTSGSIDIAAVQRSLGIAPGEAIDQLIASVANHHSAQVIEQLSQLQNQGFGAPQIAKQLGQTLRQSLIEGQPALGGQITAQLMQRLIDVPAAHDPQALLEIILLDAILSSTPTAPIDLHPPTTPTPEPPAPPAPPEPKPSKPEPAKEPEPETPETIQAAPVAAEETPAPAPTAEHRLLDETGWQQVLHTLKQKHNTLYGVARMAVPIFDDGKLTLTFTFPFHQKRMNDSKNRKIVSDIIANELQANVEIICVIDKGTEPAAAKTAPAEEKTGDNPLDTISNIFGGAEVLE